MKEKALTREEYKKLKQVEEPKHVKTAQAFVILFFLIILSTTAGALVGYSVIGHGKPIDVLKGSAFFHVYDLVEKK